MEVKAGQRIHADNLWSTRRQFAVHADKFLSTHGPHESRREVVESLCSCDQAHADEGIRCEPFVGSFGISFKASAFDQNEPPDFKIQQNLT